MISLHWEVRNWNNPLTAHHREKCLSYCNTWPFSVVDYADFHGINPSHLRTEDVQAIRNVIVKLAGDETLYVWHTT